MIPPISIHTYNGLFNKTPIMLIYPSILIPFEKKTQKHQPTT